jgi:hypothetical protein
MASAGVLFKRVTSRRGNTNSFLSPRSDKNHNGILNGDADGGSESDEKEDRESRVRRRYTLLVKKIFHPMNRKNLVDRLIFEEDLRSGFFLLLRHLLVFVFIMETLNISKNVKAMRGIYIDLDNSFEFDDLRSISSRDDFISNWIPALSESSKKYFVRGSRYFDTGGAGSVQLHSGTVQFSEPVSLGGFSVSIQLQSFSFTAWVQLVPEFVEGYIFRKRLLPTSKMTCWGELRYLPKNLRMFRQYIDLCLCHDKFCLCRCLLLHTIYKVRRTCEFLIPHLV